MTRPDKHNLHRRINGILKDVKKGCDDLEVEPDEEHGLIVLAKYGGCSYA